MCVYLSVCMHVQMHAYMCVCGLDDWGSIISKGKDFFSSPSLCPYRLWSTPSQRVQRVPGFFPCGQSVNLITYL
jgi:hypothetical protein